MRVLIVSPIGVTRHVLENWLTPLGHKVLSAETFDSATRQLSANPGIELVITEWLLGGQNAFDVLKKTQQITCVSDAAETVTTIRMIVMVTPGWENQRLKFQMDMLKASDHVAFMEKPVNRDVVHQVIKKLFSASPAEIPAVNPGRPVGADQNIQRDGKTEADLLRETVLTQQETLRFLAKLHAEAQQKLEVHTKQDLAIPRTGDVPGALP